MKVGGKTKVTSSQNNTNNFEDSELKLGDVKAVNGLLYATNKDGVPVSGCDTADNSSFNKIAVSWLQKVKLTVV